MIFRYIPLENTTTTGVILCEQVKSLDIENRGYKVVETVSENILNKVLEILYLEFEKID